MFNISKYKNYIKDNPQGYWFKAKLFGWGWMPVKWQGVLFLIIWIAVFMLVSLSTVTDLAKSIILAILIAVLLFVCFKKGEKPHWQWGIPDKYKEGKDEEVKDYQ